MWMVGAAMTTLNATEIMYNLGINVVLTNLTGKLIQIGGFLAIALIVAKLPIFIEVKWEENMIQIYIIHKEIGTPLFHKNFREENQEITETLMKDLVAGGMAGITTMLKEISGSAEELKIIDHGDQKIMLEHGDKYLIALNVEEEMLIYRERLRKLRKFLDAEFTDILASWDGNMKVFEPIEGIVEKLFR